MDDLTFKELEIIGNALHYTNEIYQNQIKLVEKEHNDKKIELVEYLKSQKFLIKKIEFIDSYFDRFLNKSTMNIFRDKSKNGFLVIDMFYIIGLLFSVLTIVYILMK
ncbi:MAG: hypothetical protein IJ509_01865 [Bacilli bacterium]|nr:hypothetical protein [Bacilli bacterium]